MRLIIEVEGELYRLWVEHGGRRRPLLIPGDHPSWAGGWAGRDGRGAYPHQEAVQALCAFGVSRSTAKKLLRLQKGAPQPQAKDGRGAPR